MTACERAWEAGARNQAPQSAGMWAVRALGSPNLFEGYALAIPVFLASIVLCLLVSCSSFARETSA